MNEPVIVTRVSLTPSKLMDEMSRALLDEVIRLVPYSGFQPTASLESSDILKYLNTLIFMRCQHVVDPAGKVFNLKSKCANGLMISYRDIYRKVMVPSLMYQLLISIGEAYDRDYAIKFLPEYQVESKELLSVEEMVALSNLFLMIRHRGFSAVEGCPNDIAGELDFMAMCHVEEVVKSYRSSHPVYGFLAAFFAQQQLNEITGMMCRIVYGYDTDYMLAVRSVMTSLSHERPEVSPGESKG